MNAVVIDEELQIVRATLKVVVSELHQVSPKAGRAVERAVCNLDLALQEFANTREAVGLPEKGGSA
jgi:hypothetical protein